MWTSVDRTHHLARGGVTVYEDKMIGVVVPAQNEQIPIGQVTKTVSAAIADFMV